jgi:hypothetical protein
LTSALNITDHARTDVQGRYWEVVYDCEDFFSNSESDWIEEEDWFEDQFEDDEERDFCEALSEWRQDVCFGSKGLNIHCYGNSCEPEWEDSDGLECQTYQEKEFCTEEGEYDIGWNEDIRGEFQPGTAGLNAFEPCTECGACSADEFLEEHQRMSLSNIIIPVAFGMFALVWLCFCCRAYRLEKAETAAVTAPAQVQPVMQPATNIVINNTGFQPAPTQQFQPQQQYQPAPYAAPPNYAPPSYASPPPPPQQNNWGPFAGQR